MRRSRRPAVPHRPAAPSPDRLQRYRRGWTSEIVASVALMAKGYRILARRHRTPLGEIDLIAVRGRRLAFVEVKRRNTLAEAEASLTLQQRQRMRRSAEYWLGRHPRYRNHSIGLDAVLIVPHHWPRHLPDSLNLP